MARPLRALVFSTLYPSAERPGHGIFVETRLRHLLATGDVEARVVAPVPWFPFTGAQHGERAAMARTARREQRHGIDVLHPRYLVLPKIGMHVAPALLAFGAARALSAWRAEGFDFDLIDAHYFYPDGVAAALLARWFDRPLVITARGSDVNLIGEFALPRRMMRWAARSAVASIGVSAALAERLRALGAPPERVHVATNGVDTTFFAPVPREQARAHLGVGGAPLLLSVGNLLEVKRHHLVIDALARLRERHPQARLAIVGQGPLREALRARADAAGLGDAVVLAGAVPQAELRHWYSAADLLVLASSREGWPNVLLEAMACGTRVLASRVGGVPEIVNAPELGAALPVDDGDALAAALLALLERPADPRAVRAHAERHGWAATSRLLVDRFREAMPANRAA